jgi:hypothetical protein
LRWNKHVGEVVLWRNDRVLCGKNRTQGIVFPRQLGVEASNVTSSITLSTPSPSATSSALSNHPQPNTKGQRDIGIGVSVGIRFPVVILSTVALFLFFKKHHRPEVMEINEEEGAAVADDKEPIAVVQELETPRTELQAGVDSVELP